MRKNGENSLTEILKLITQNPLLTGVTFSGGEPFLQPVPFTKLAKKIHNINLSVMAYTGYVFESLLKNKANSSKERFEFLNNIDILVDGPFKVEEKSLLLKFKGSKNQRIIDVKKSLSDSKTVVIG